MSVAIVLPSDETEYLLTRNETRTQRIIFYSILSVICALFTTGGICIAVIFASKI
jgi:hypothetical protein